MTLEIRAIGGYNEVGKNMTAVHIDGTVLILDMGLHLDVYIRHFEDDEFENIRTDDLLAVGAVPDITLLKDWMPKVKAIIPTHAHLDHVGAIPFLEHKFSCPIICTPYTDAVLRAIARDQKIRLKNPIKVLHSNSRIKLSNDITIEFVHVTHSTPQTVMVAIHTKYGIILYGNDFKFDQNPQIGRKPNLERLEQIGNEGVLALIVDSLYAHLPRKTPSESVAKEMLYEVLLGTESKGKAIIVTTFASHLARLKSIIHCGKQLRRKIVFLGRSLAKYTLAGEEVGIVHFSKEVDIVRYGNKIKRRLKQIERDGPEKYLLVVTGHQGEPKATLARMANGNLPFHFNYEDMVVFSSQIIPNELNKTNREKLEESLRQQGVRIFRDIHVSGHASREDHRDLINLVKPKHIIPAHGTEEIRSGMLTLAQEMHYNIHEGVHLLHNGQVLHL